MTTIYSRIENNFTQISNQALLDVRLSGKAYKLYAYMCYRIGTAPHWDFNEKEILKHFKEGREALRKSFKELIEAGWLIKKQKRNAGKFSKNEYEIFSSIDSAELTPSPKKTTTVETSTEESTTANHPYNNKEVINKELNNKDLSFPDEKEEEENLNDLKEIEKLMKNPKNLSEQQINEAIIHYFEIKGYKSNVEEFLLYYKGNTRGTFKKLPYYTAKWEEKFEELNKTSKKGTFAKKIPDMSDFMKAKMEYAKKNLKNPDHLTDEEVNNIKRSLEND